MLDFQYISTLPKDKFLASIQICEDFFEQRLKDAAVDVSYTLIALLGADALNFESNRLDIKDERSLFDKLLFRNDVEN
ncbi:MAG: hypothetical protein COB78_04015 [Hyphomicrobiales bacterium]|nr:MAG: hypothetical protein COB78_04015 [Hyphomicrobiales bacterium]